MLLPSRNAGPSHAITQISAIRIMSVFALLVRLVLRRLRRGQVCVPFPWILLAQKLGQVGICRHDFEYCPAIFLQDWPRWRFVCCLRSFQSRQRTFQYQAQLCGVPDWIFVQMSLFSSSFRCAVGRVKHRLFAVSTFYTCHWFCGLHSGNLPLQPFLRSVLPCQSCRA